MALHLASKSCRSHSQLKAFRSAIASLKLKRKATASEQDHSRPSLKSFRHFAATFLVNAGVPIEIIKDFMGHRNISTTMIYAKVKTDTLKKAGLAFDQSGVSTKCPQEGT